MQASERTITTYIIIGLIVHIEPMMVLVLDKCWSDDQIVGVGVGDGAGDGASDCADTGGSGGGGAGASHGAVAGASGVDWGNRNNSNSRTRARVDWGNCCNSSIIASH